MEHLNVDSYNCNSGQFAVTSFTLTEGLFKWIIFLQYVSTRILTGSGNDYHIVRVGITYICLYMYVSMDNRDATCT